MAFVEVAVNSGLPHRQTFSYAVPDGMTLQAGDGVFVPFGRRSVQGIVMAVVAVPAFADPKPVEARIGEEPVISAERVELARWIADYYLAPLFSAVALMLPPGFERRALTYYESLVGADELDATRLPPRQRTVLEQLVTGGRREAKELERDLPRLSGLATALSQLAQRGLAQRSYGLARPSVSRKMARYAYLLAAPPVALAAAEALSEQRKGRAGAALRLLAEDGPSLPASELRLRAGATLPVLRQLAEEGLVEVREEPVQRDPLAGRHYEPRPAPPLTPEQARAFEPVRAALDDSRAVGQSGRPKSGVGVAGGDAGTPPSDQSAVWANSGVGAGGGAEGTPLFDQSVGQAGSRANSGVGAAGGGVRVDGEAGRTPLLDQSERPPTDQFGVRGKTFLLHGVTGSGKTEVYLRALERAIALGKRAIVLVPEIALTPQTVRRFAERFPGQVAVLHSGLSQGELFDQWHGIREGRYAVVVGSRSAVFAPQPDLGLIVIDEEHEWTYKQQDQSPRYHAREAAERLAGLTGAVVILGSATPDVESYQRALWGRYELLELRERVRPVFARASGVGTAGRGVGAGSGAEGTPLLDQSAGGVGVDGGAEGTPLLDQSAGGVGVDGEAGRTPLLDQSAGGVGVDGEAGRTPLLSQSRPPLDQSGGRFSGEIVGVVSSLALPPVDVVDMREELKGGNRSIFSRSLQLGLFQAFERREQAILFLNRRGTAGFLQCRDCGFVPQCAACAIALSYHKHVRHDGSELERLLCHQCNRTRRPFERCPMCGGARLRPMGLGVEAVEEAVRETFPGVRTLRWDRDVTQGRHAHEQILASFLEGKAEVLVGTQMVAKGLDLPSVTIVGVISADVGLHIPDFRAAERTFQLLTQVAGRAGRAASADGGPQAGRVVIQTYTPDNYAIVAAARHDYAEFFAAEIELRREEAYPPFVRLARLVYSHANPERAEREAAHMARELKLDAAQRGLPGVEVLGPAPPHVPKWHGRFRQQVTVRSPDPAELLGSLALPEGWILDIDPASLA